MRRIGGKYDCAREGKGVTLFVWFTSGKPCYRPLGIDQKEEAGENGTSPAWSMPDTRYRGLALCVVQR